CQLATNLSKRVQAGLGFVIILRNDDNIIGQFYELSTQQLTVSAQDDRFKLSAKLISQTSTSTGKALCCLVEGSRSENTNCDVVHGSRGKLLQQQYVLPMSRPF